MIKLKSVGTIREIPMPPTPFQELPMSEEERKKLPPMVTVILVLMDAPETNQADL